MYISVVPIVDTDIKQLTVSDSAHMEFIFKIDFLSNELLELVINTVDVQC